jgi:hypothetical protein
MQLPQSLLRLLPLPAWQALITAFAPDLRSPTELSAVPSVVGSTPALRDAVATIAMLATDDGHAALLRAAADAQVEVASWPRGDSAALAHYLVLQSLTDARIPPLFASARVQLAELPTRETTFEFVAVDARRLRSFRVTGSLEADLRTALERAFERDARHNAVEVHIEAPDPQGDVGFDILRSDHARRVVAALSGKKRAEAVTIVVYRSDSIRLDKKRGRLVISTIGASLPEIYRRAFGEVLFGEAGFFLATQSVDLRPLQERGADALRVPTLAADISAARVIELEWDSGEDDVIGLSGRDVMRSIERRAIGIHGGTIDRATLRLDFVDGGPKADISIAPPHAITVHPEERRAIAIRFADAAGFTTSAPRREDLFSLEPWIHQAARWRPALGEAFTAFCEQGILVEEQARMLVAPESPGAGRALLAFPFPGKPGSFFATSRNRSVAPRTLTRQDLSAYRLDLARYGAFLAKELNAKVDVQPTELKGVLEIGTLRLEDREVRLVLVASAAHGGAKALGRALRATTKHSLERVLLVPKGRKVESSDLVIELATIAGPHRAQVIPPLRRALGLPDETPATPAKKKRGEARWRVECHRPARSVEIGPQVEKFSAPLRSRSA